jgi:hypothetical protein
MMHGPEKVGPCHSSREANEQGGAIRCGVGGAKGRDQGECGPAKHVPDTAPGRRITRAGAHTQSRKRKEEGQVHRALSPCQRRPAQGGVLSTQEEHRTGSRSTPCAGRDGRWAPTRRSASGRNLRRSGCSCSSGNGPASGSAIDAERGPRPHSVAQSHFMAYLSRVRVL